METKGWKFKDHSGPAKLYVVKYTFWLLIVSKTKGICVHMIMSLYICQFEMQYRRGSRYNETGGKKGKRVLHS